MILSMYANFLANKVKRGVIMSGYVREGRSSYNVYEAERRRRIRLKEKQGLIPRVPQKAPYGDCFREGNEKVPVTRMLNGGRNIDKENQTKN